jgi:uncharacterized protein with GYD domain
MPTYIGLLQYTPEGAKRTKERWAQGNPNDEARKAAKAMSCELKSSYLTMGQYDMVVIVEAPDDAAMAKLAMAQSMRGTFHTETMRAFTESEFEKIAKELP